MFSAMQPMFQGCFYFEVEVKKLESPGNDDEDADNATNPIITAGEEGTDGRDYSSNARTLFLLMDVFLSSLSFNT